jgi:C1A family cysteine protease
MFNHIIAVILSIVMSFSNLLFSNGILSSIRERLNKDDDKLSSISESFYYDENGVMYKKYVDNNGNVVDPSVFKSSTPSTRASANATLPTSYDSRTKDLVTTAKNQGGTGCCWAFATCSVLESSLISQGYATKSNIDLSEAHLAWFTNKSYVEGSSNPLDAEGISVTSPFDIGGNWLVAACQLNTWSGSANETSYPFNYSDTTKMQFAESERYASTYHLTAAEDYGEATAAQIKQAIIDNGSVEVSMYYSSSNIKSSSNGYCYYQNSVTGSNHAVTIIGWDDNFAASNFATAPSANGAWLIKNSWGSTWGSSGCFWISYSDTSLSGYAVLKAEPATDFQHNYQYDGFGALSYVYYNSATGYESNIFTANGHEQIGGTGFYTQNSNATCKISVYTGVTSTTNPKSGTLAGTKTVTLAYPGYHTVKFDTPYEITKGTKFSIVVQFTVASGYAYLPIEGENFDLYSDGTTVHYTSSTSQSFLSGNGTSWVDSSSSGYNNTPIKAFTNDIIPNFELKSGATVSIASGNYISGIYPGSMTPAQLTAMFSNDVRTDAQTLYTGAKLNLYEDGAVKNTATVVVFGDLNGDGLSDGGDAVIISAIMLGMLNSTNLDPAYLKAADYDNDGTITQTDFNYVFNSGLSINSGTIGG